MDLVETKMKDPIKHWYYTNKYNAIRDFMKTDLQKAKVLVDVGAGSALFAHEILKSASHLSCFAIDTGYKLPTFYDAEKRITFLQSSNQTRGEIYLFTDVLEHVSDDVKLLKSYVDSAPIGALFVITVPAFMSLWSGHDIFLKHFRRYRKDSLSYCVVNAGLSIEDARYLYVILFPIVWLIRKLSISKKIESQMKNHGQALNAIATFILKSDRALARIFPFGVSIILSARKIN